MNLGKTIKKIRKQKKLSQETFANQSGISQTYLSQIENDKREPNLSTLKSISTVLGIPLPILFFLSTTEDDIPLEKRELFKAIDESLTLLIHGEFKV